MKNDKKFQSYDQKIIRSPILISWNSTSWPPLVRIKSGLTGKGISFAMFIYIRNIIIKRHIANNNSNIVIKRPVDNNYFELFLLFFLVWHWKAWNNSSNREFTKKNNQEDYNSHFFRWNFFYNLISQTNGKSIFQSKVKIWRNI